MNSRRLSLSDMQEAFGYRSGTKTSLPDGIEKEWRKQSEEERKQWYENVQKMTRRERQNAIRKISQEN